MPHYQWLEMNADLVACMDVKTSLLDCEAKKNEMHDPGGFVLLLSGILVGAIGYRLLSR